MLRTPPRATRNTSVSKSSNVPSARGTAFGSTRDLDLGGGADDAAARGAGVLSAASSFSFRLFSKARPALQVPLVLEEDVAVAEGLMEQLPSQGDHLLASKVLGA